MTPAILERSRSVLEFRSTTLNVAHFVGDRYAIDIPKHVWVELGSPREITIMVEAGNQIEAEF